MCLDVPAYFGLVLWHIPQSRPLGVYDGSHPWHLGKISKLRLCNLQLKVFKLRSGQRFAAYQTFQLCTYLDMTCHNTCGASAVGTRRFPQA